MNKSRNNFTGYHFSDLLNLSKHRHDAVSMINGDESHPNLEGRIRFWQTPWGTLVVAEITGLPGGICGKHGVFGLHIHEGGACTGTDDDPFADTGSHYNPTQAPHPCHAGDLPPLFSSGGTALSAVLTDRFNVSEIIGKTVIIHSAPDDFTTQPAGNAGHKIACGPITASEAFSE